MLRFNENIYIKESKCVLIKINNKKKMSQIDMFDP